MGVLGSFRKEVMVKELKNLCFTDEKCLEKVIANCQRAVVLGSVRVIKNHLSE